MHACCGMLRGPRSSMAIEDCVVAYRLLAIVCEHAFHAVLRKVNRGCDGNNAMRTWASCISSRSPRRAATTPVYVNPFVPPDSVRCSFLRCHFERLSRHTHGFGVSTGSSLARFGDVISGVDVMPETSFEMSRE